MALNNRQRRAYNHLCDVYRSARTIGSGALPSAEQFQLVALAVPCHYEYTPNVDDPSGAGVGDVKRMTILTTDVVHFAQDAPVTNNCLLLNKTLLPDGTHSPNYGAWHRVLGAPRIIPDSGHRRAHKRSVMAMEMEHPPAGVV